MTESLNHKLDVSKIKTLKDINNVFECMNLIASMSEDNEQYEIAKEYFTIPYVEPKLEFKLPRKSLEEISQEFDEKIDKQVEKVKEKFNQLGYTQEYQFSKKITRIIEDFEYARKNGSFPAKLDYSNLIATGSNITSSFVIKQGNKHEGYYTFGNCRSFKYYMPTKPNFVIRFCMKNLLGFFWVDEK